MGYSKPCDGLTSLLTHLQTLRNPFLCTWNIGDNSYLLHKVIQRLSSVVAGQCGFTCRGRQKKMLSWVFHYFWSQMGKAFAMCWKISDVLFIFVCHIVFFTVSPVYTLQFLLFCDCCHMLWGLMIGEQSCLYSTLHVLQDFVSVWFVFVFSLGVHMASGLFRLIPSSGGRKKIAFQNRLWPIFSFKKNKLNFRGFVSFHVCTLCFLLISVLH